MKKLFLTALAMFSVANANAEIITGETSMTEQAQKQYVKLETKYGDVFFEFFEQDAPKHVEAFKKLTEKGFYNGLVFHRVIAGFVAQTGDPTGTGTGGPGYTLDAEFNERKHVKGALGMARSGHPDSAGSQFYFVLDDAPHLNRQYTVFGQVVKGMENIDQIKQGDKMENVTLVTEID